MPVGQVRTRAKGIGRLFDFVKSATDVQGLAVGYNTTPDEAQAMHECLGSVFSKDKIILSKIGPLLGVHAGPGALGVTFREG